MSSEKKPQPLIAPKPQVVSCLNCEKVFKSPDKRSMRLCPVCRQRK